MKIKKDQVVRFTEETRIKIFTEYMHWAKSELVHGGCRRYVENNCGLYLEDEQGIDIVSFLEKRHIVKDVDKFLISGLNGYTYIYEN